MIKYMKKIIRRRKLGTRIVLRYREKLLCEGHKNSWGNVVPDLTCPVYLYQKYDAERETGYDEVKMSWMVANLNYADMLCESSFWEDYFRDKNNKGFTKKYKNRVIYIRETGDGGWIIL